MGLVTLIAKILLLLNIAAHAGDVIFIAIPDPEIKGNVEAPFIVSVVARSEAGHPLEYQWSKDGKILAGQTGSAFLTKSAKISDAGVYSVTVKNSVESKVLESKVSISKTKLRPTKRVPAAKLPAAVHCHN